MGPVVSGKVVWGRIVVAENVWVLAYLTYLADNLYLD